MKIKKLGHSCLVIEEEGLRILTDPGSFTTAQNELKNINLILITHEHQDHLHVESLKKVLANNPGARVLTNKGVEKILDNEGIKYELLEQGQSTTVSDVLIEGFGEWHAVIYPTVSPVSNTGYFIQNKLFYPGDAFTNPGKPVDILALPTSAPWLKISEAIDYAKEIKPKTCFSVHDFITFGAIDRFGPHILGELGIQFVSLGAGGEIEL